MVFHYTYHVNWVTVEFFHMVVAVHVMEVFVLMRPHPDPPLNYIALVVAGMDMTQKEAFRFEYRNMMAVAVVHKMTWKEIVRIDGIDLDFVAFQK